jgi:hypothetical protein
MPEVSIENNNIYEDKYDQQNDFDKVRRTLMDKDQIKRADFYVKKFDELKSEKNTLETEWIEIEEGFASDRCE